MARKQTRRSVSVKGITYQRIKNYVREHGGSVTRFVEDLVLEKLGPPDAEDRRKFGEDMKRREKEAEARKAEEKADELAGYVEPIKFL